MESNRNLTRPEQGSAGFTLPEIIIALFIASFMTLGLTQFMLGVTKGVFWGAEKAEITEDVRSFTMRLAAEARSANFFVIYSSFAANDRDKGVDRRDDQQSGDCLVLANTEYYPDTSGTEHYTEIIVYYRKAEADSEENTGPVYRFEWVAASPSEYYDTADNTLEQVLTKIAPTDENGDPIVIELSRGIANGRLFTNHNSGGVCVVSGEILHGNASKEVTNTYNLSISPRG